MITITIMTTATMHGHDHHHHDGGGLKHYHDEEMQSVSLKTDKPLDPDKFFPWVQDLVQKDGPSILRCKGILSFKDDPERFVFQGVHMILDGDHQRAMEGRREAREPHRLHRPQPAGGEDQARASRAASRERTMHAIIARDRSMLEQLRAAPGR